MSKKVKEEEKSVEKKKRGRPKKSSPKSYETDKVKVQQPRKDELFYPLPWLTEEINRRIAKAKKEMKFGIAFLIPFKMTESSYMMAIRRTIQDFEKVGYTTWMDIRPYEDREAYKVTIEWDERY